jgi:hypothetical protein
MLGRRIIYLLGRLWGMAPHACSTIYMCSLAQR